MISLRGVIALIAFYSLNWVVVALGIYCVARSVTYIPFDDILLVGSAQAIGYVAALVTLVAPAGLGVRDAAFAWAVKAALPGKQLRARLADRDRRARRDDGGRTDLRRRRHRAGPPRGLGDPDRDPASVARGGGGGARTRRKSGGGARPEPSSRRRADVALSERDAGAQLVGGEGEGQELERAVAGEGGQGQGPDQVPGEEPGGGEEEAEAAQAAARTQSPPRQVQSEQVGDERRRRGRARRRGPRRGRGR